MPTMQQVVDVIVDAYKHTQFRRDSVLAKAREYCEEKGWSDLNAQACDEGWWRRINSKLTKVGNAEKRRRRRDGGELAIEVELPFEENLDTHYVVRLADGGSLVVPRDNMTAAQWVQEANERYAMAVSNRRAADQMMDAYRLLEPFWDEGIVYRDARGRYLAHLGRQKARPVRASAGAGEVVTVDFRPPPPAGPAPVA